MAEILASIGPGKNRKDGFTVNGGGLVALILVFFLVLITAIVGTRKLWYKSGSEAPAYG
jgi:hypothetical protein